MSLCICTPEYQHKDQAIERSQRRPQSKGQGWAGALLLQGARAWQTGTMRLCEAVHPPALLTSAPGVSIHLLLQTLHIGKACTAVTVMFAAEKVDWVEKFVRVGTKVTEAARNEHDK